MSDISLKQKRKFINLSQVSRYLYCTLCNEIFFDAKRIPCGHTFCNDCLLNWADSHNECPICQQYFTVNNIQRDLIGFNMVNELEVYCVNCGCPWKGILQNLEEHLSICYFDPYKIPEFIKNIVCSKEEAKSTTQDDEYTSNNKALNFNTKVSLKARLYSKNKTLMEKMISKNKKKIKSDSLFDIIIK